MNHSDISHYLDTLLVLKPSNVIFIHSYACVLIKNIFVNSFVNAKNILITSFNIRFSPTYETYFYFASELLKGVRDFLKPSKYARINAHLNMRLCGFVSS